MKSRVCSSDIGVVVQGPVVGKPDDAPAARHTCRCLQSVRQHLPGAQVILSTYESADVRELDYDVLVRSDDPGALPFRQDGTVNNVNRQIVTTRAGLEKVSRPFALKLRSDLLLTGDGFLRWWGRWGERRVLSCTVYARNPRRFFPYPFHPSDWFFFGRTNDVRAIWDIALAPEPEMSRWFETRPRPTPDVFPHQLNRYTPEQYVWLSFLRKHGSVECEHQWDSRPGVWAASERSFADHLVLLTPNQLQIRFLKYNIARVDWATLYTHNEWRGLQGRYCGPKRRQLLPRWDAERLVKQAFVACFLPRSAAVPGLLARARRAFPLPFRWGQKLYHRLLQQ